jgi:hypothetical protein
VFAAVPIEMCRPWQVTTQRERETQSTPRPVHPIY